MTISEVKRMNRKLFERWLRDRLDDLPPEELERICAFYLDAIADRMEEGMTEEQAIHDLGEPEALLEGIRASLPEHTAYRPSRKSLQPEASRRKWLLGAAGVALLVVSVLTPVLWMTRTVVHTVVEEVPVIEPGSFIAPIDSSNYATEQAEVIQISPDPAAEVSYCVGDAGQLTVCVLSGALLVGPSPDDDLHLLGPHDYVLRPLDDDTILLEDVQTDLQLLVPESLALLIKSDMGDVSLSDVRPLSLQVSCALGDISLDRVSARDSIVLESQLGSIFGVLPGSQREYTIHSSSAMGSNTLPDEQKGGEIALTVTADTGSVELFFGAE